MTLEPGQRVRTLVELVASDGTLLAEGWIGHVIGYQGSKLLVDIRDQETDTSWTVTVNVWEVRRA